MAEGNRSNTGATVDGSSEAKSEDGTGGGSESGALNKGTERIRTQLAEHLDSLHFVNGALIVCIQALRQQAAEMDEEIALVLQRTVGDKLDETIDRIEAIALGIEFKEA